MYRKMSEGWFKHYDFVLFDIFCLQLSFVAAYIISGNGFHPYESLLYRNMAVFLVLMDMISLFLFQTLKGVLKRGYYQNFVFTVRHVLMLGAMSTAYLFLSKQGQQYSRAALLLNFAIYLPLTYLIRELWKKYLRNKMENGGDRTLLIITYENIAEEVTRNIQQHNYARYKIVGIALFDDHSKADEISGVEVVVCGNEIPDYVCREWIDEVMIVTEDGIYPEELIEKLSKTGVTIHRNLTKIIWEKGKKQLIEKIGSYTVLTTSINHASPFPLFVKRLMDITGGIVGCVITVLIFIFIGPILYYHSKGPIFFVQERVGKNGKRFKMYKFRSMKMNAEQEKEKLMKDNKMEDGKMFKMEFDPRIIGNEILPDGTRKTGIGDFIRRTSLDEFPQFFNVLKGEMSIVGTRPPLPDEVDLYELHHHARLAIKPGITGLWQVSGRSRIMNFEEVVKLDREYIENWNIGLDIKILFKTILVVLKRDGAE